MEDDIIAHLEGYCHPSCLFCAEELLPDDEDSFDEQYLDDWQEIGGK